MATISKYSGYVESAPTPTPTSESSPPQGSGPPSPKGRRWKLPRRWRLLALIALIILFMGGSATFLISWLPGVLPAATATVTITPASQHLTKTYTLYAVTGTPDASQHQVAARARLLSYTTPEKSLTVAATGQGSTRAAGILIFSHASTAMIISGGQGFSGASGVSLFMDTGVDIWPGQTVAVTAHAAEPGPGGNVPADDVNATFSIYDHGNGPYIGTVHVENTAPFTGGKDNAYSFVQQSDIDDATDELVSQLTSDAQAAMQRQLRANEELVLPIQCTPRTKANDRASDVTVTGSVTCKGEAYDVQTARSMAASLLRNDAASQLDAHYALVGDIQIGTPQVSTPDENGMATLNVPAEGVWVYQFSEAQKQTFAQLIAWKPLADAQSLLLKQVGVKKVSITTIGGWGSALPTAANDIKFSIVAVPGLQASV